MRDFDFKGAAELPYSPKDCDLSVWRDEDHLPPQETVAAERKSQTQTADVMIAETAKDKLCMYALSQVGYHEGVNNWNKYAEVPEMQQWYGWKPQSTYWCDTFADACFVACFGLELASQMTYQPVGSGSALCRTSADYYKEHGAFYQTPEIGDEIFFYVSGDINHVGIVVRVDGGSVHTVEGNSSDMVAERVYSITDSSIAGYGRPNWEAANLKGIKDYGVGVEPGEPGIVEEQRSYTLSFPYLSKGSTGDAVRTIQMLLQARNIYCGSYGADGDFGPGTEKGVRDFQRRHNLAVDGVVGPETGAALFSGEVYTPEKTEPEASSFWNNLLAKIKK